MPRNRKVNQADVQAIVAGTIRGKKQKDIAKEIGLQQQTVSQTLRTPEGIATMREMLGVHREKMDLLVAKMFTRMGEQLDASGDNAEWKHNEGIRRVQELMRILAQNESHQLNERIAQQGRGTIRLEQAILLLHQEAPKP